MTAYLYQRGGKYKYCLQYYDSDGNRKQKWINTGLLIRGNKRNAEKMRLSIISKWQFILEPHGTAYQNHLSKMLFSEFLLHWLDIEKQEIQPSTYSEYKRVIESHIAPYFEEKSLITSNIHHRHIQEYYQTLLEKGLSANTVLRYHANIQKSLRYALENGIITVNPANLVKLPSVPKYISTIYNIEDLKRLFAVLNDDTLFLAVLIGITYGLRRSELLGLTWSSIDFLRNVYVNLKTSQKMAEI